MYIDFDPSSEERSLGKYLKSVREEKEISLEELAENTKIKQEYLEAIEADKYELLPEGPYLILFLKSYSEALELQYEKVLSYLQAATAQQGSRPSKSKIPQPAPAPPAVPREQPAPESKPPATMPVIDSHDKSTAPIPARAISDTRKYLAIIGMLVFAAFVVVIIIIIATRKPSDSETGAEGALRTDRPHTTLIDSAALKLKKFLDSFDSLTVSIYPASQQAITIVADNRPQTKLVYPERIWTVSAADSLMISCEYADSSRIFINGYILKDSALALAGRHSLAFNRSNWVEYVDTTERP